MRRLGRYQVIQELGRGAMGTVYRARDPKIDRVVALKTISIAGASAGEQEEYRQRFFREAQAAGKLSHPGLVVIHDVGEDEATRTPFIVMEFVEGKTLDDLGRAERLPVEQALALAKQVAEALDYAHSRQIVHRDIKPANILVTEEGRAKITDFGIAKLAMTQMTQTGQILGTPAYMSPEQLSGGTVDGRSDLFSLGVILYWLLTGEKPFAGDTTTAVSFKIVYQDPIPASRLNPGLSPDHDYVLARALVKDPSRRYQRGREMADDLEDLLHGRVPRSRAAFGAGAAEVERTLVAQPRGAAPTPTATVKMAAGAAVVAAASPKKRKWWRAAAAILLLFLLGGLGWWWAGPSETEEGGQSGGPAVREAAASGPSAAKRTGSESTGSPAQTQPTTSGSRREQEPPPTAPSATPQRDTTRVAQPRRRAVPQAALRLTGEHNFEMGTVYVYVDDDRTPVREFRIHAEGGRLPPIASATGHISARLPVAPGKHTISVRVRAPRDDFDQIEYIDGNFKPGQPRTLEVSFGKLGKWVGIGELTRNLTLRWLD